jgi:hypothetical protein
MFEYACTPQGREQFDGGAAQQGLRIVQPGLNLPGSRRVTPGGEDLQRLGALHGFRMLE